MPQIPRDKSFDSSLALLREGYAFIMRRCRRFGSDVFQTRLLLQRTLCMGGEEAASIFYDGSRFKRKNAVPHILQETLLGRGGVQHLDGPEHRKRKAMFMSLMTPEGIRQMVDLATGQWHAYIGKWEKMDNVVLFDELQEILCRAVCRWTGVPLKESEVRRRTHDLQMMVEGAGSVGPRHIQGRLARNRAEGWGEALVRRVREHDLDVPEDSALHKISWYRDVWGRLLTEHVASVELLNVLRPTVAASRFLVFAAHALHSFPESRMKLQSGQEGYSELFAQEVRRFYPLFPFVPAKVRREFTWKGYRFPNEVRVMLDLYGTNQDPREWDAPREFRPERFLTWDGSPFNFIPQGGGDHFTGHRCAGEWLTIELIKSGAEILTTDMAYDVPEQDLSISLSRMPANVKSGFVINNVRRLRVTEGARV